MKINFDFISDLNLSPGETLDWDGKATSLYCLVGGNISSDTKTLNGFLNTLAKYYQGVFFIPGTLEYKDSENIDKRTNEIGKLCKKIKNLVFLQNNVVIIEGVAILGANGWSNESIIDEVTDVEKHELNKYEDISYLKSTIEKLQRHLDVKKIVVITNSVPNENLYFGEVPKNVENEAPLTISLLGDLEKKVTHWAFGTHQKIVDTTIQDINYLNNPYHKSSTYWAKIIEIEV